MIKLLNESDKTYEMRMTKKPISNPQSSPEPTGVSLDSLNPNDANYNVQRNAILNHPNYSESKVVYLNPGINEFQNDEHAEYFYKQLGNPVDGGAIYSTAQNQTVQIENKNFVWEVDEKGEKIEGPLFNKYRRRSMSMSQQRRIKANFEPVKE